MMKSSVARNQDSVSGGAWDAAGIEQGGEWEGIMPLTAD